MKKTKKKKANCRPFRWHGLRGGLVHQTTHASLAINSQRRILAPELAYPSPWKMPTACSERNMRLKAANIVVSWNYRHDQYGFPIETEFAPKDQGVAVYFTLNGRAMVMACDRYQRAAANLRSLGLALEAMRQLARHGGGVMMERAFAGFVALPPPPSCWDGSALKTEHPGWTSNGRFVIARRKCIPTPAVTIMPWRS